MARKSRELRLAQTLELITKYDNAGLCSHKNIRFAKDMANRLELGRGLSKKQRAWLDSIIMEPVPEPQNKKLYEQIIAARDTDGMQGKVQILNDFAHKAFNGWKLSSKQENWLNKMLSEAINMRINGPWKPSLGIIEQLKLCIQLSLARSSNYWYTHVGTAKALESVTKWLEHETSHVPTGEGTNPYSIDEWSCSKLIDSFRVGLRQLENSKFNPGDMAWFYSPEEKQWVHALVTAGSHVNESGDVMYSALVNGQMVETKKLAKRRS